MARRLPTGGRKASSPKVVPIRANAAPIGDNSGISGEEQEHVQLVSFIARITEADADCETTKAPYDAAKKKRKGVFDLAHAAGFTSEELKARILEMSRAPAENARHIARERRHRRWLRVESDEQTKMHLDGNTPQEAKDEYDWQTRGFGVGVRGLPATLPEGIPPRMDQPFLKGHEAGRAEYMAALQANVPGGRNVRAQAAADFQADNPDIPEPGSPEAKKLEREAVKRAKESLEKMKRVGDEIVDDDPLGVNAAEWVEATEGELAAQTPRQAVHAVREADSEEVI